MSKFAENTTVLHHLRAPDGGFSLELVDFPVPPTGLLDLARSFARSLQPQGRPIACPDVVSFSGDKLDIPDCPELNLPLGINNGFEKFRTFVQEHVGIAPETQCEVRTLPVDAAYCVPEKEILEIRQGMAKAEQSADATWSGVTFVPTGPVVIEWRGKN